MSSLAHSLAAESASQPHAQALTPTAHPAGKPRPRRMAYGDAVRVIGTVAVVMGHVCDIPLFDSRLSPTSLDWWVCNIVDAICRFAVPVYIMLSGSLLLDPSREEPSRVFYRKRLTRIGIPLVFWSAFFLLFGLYYTGWIADGKTAMVLLVTGEPYAHLHFIFRIAGLYALTPAFRIFVKHASRSMLGTTVFILLGIWCADSVVNGFMGTKLSAFARFAPFVAYYLAGYYFREAYVSRRALAWCWVIMLTCMATLAGVTGYLCGKFGVHAYPSTSMLLLDFLSPVRIPLSICAWIILVNMFGRRDGTPEPSTRAHRLAAWLAPTTLGLYLVHPMFREILKVPYPLRDFLANHLHLNFLRNWNEITAITPNVWIGIPLVTAIVYLASLGVVLLIQRTPYLRRIVE